MEGGERKHEEKHLTPKKRKNDFGNLLIIIAGFLFIAYGFLVLLSPENYPIDGLPTGVTQIIALAVMIIGLYVLISRVGD